MKFIKDNLAYFFLGIVSLVLIFVTVNLQATIRSSQTTATADSGLIATLRRSVDTLFAPGAAPDLTPADTTDSQTTATTGTDSGSSVNEAAPLVNPDAASDATDSTSAVEELLAPVNFAPGSMAATLYSAENLTVSEDDTVLAAVISANRYAVGFFGYTYYLNNRDRLRAVAIRLPSGETVLPDVEAVAAARYPLARPLFLYTSPSVIQAKPEVEAFLGCYLNQLPQAIAATGYILPSHTLFAQAVQSFDASCQRCRREATTTHPLAQVIPSCDLANSSSNPIDIVGSSTVAPLSTWMASAVQALGYNGTIDVTGSGTSTGFSLFCDEQRGDLVDASRPVKASERERCNANNRGLLPFPVAVDALAIVVSHDNPFLESATIEELQQIFAYARTWSAINTAWPAEPIARVIPGAQSGTFDYFVEAVMEGGALTALAEQQVQPLSDGNSQLTATDIESPGNESTNIQSIDRLLLSSQNVVGSQRFMDEERSVRLGYVSLPDTRAVECTAITERMALILEANFGLTVEQIPFPDAEALVRAVAEKDPVARVDMTFCYLDPADRPLRQRYFNYTEFIDSGYRQSGDNRFVIMTNVAVKPPLERSNRCLYEFLNDLDLDNVSLSGQNPMVWYEENQAMIDSWLPCRS